MDGGPGYVRDGRPSAHCRCVADSLTLLLLAQDPSILSRIGRRDKALPRDYALVARLSGNRATPVRRGRIGGHADHAAPPTPPTTIGTTPVQARRGWL